MLEVAKGSLTRDDECLEGDGQCALNALQIGQAELKESGICFRSTFLLFFFFFLCVCVSG